MHHLVKKKFFENLDVLRFISIGVCSERTCKIHMPSTGRKLGSVTFLDDDDQITWLYQYYLSFCDILFSGSVNICHIAHSFYLNYHNGLCEKIDNWH